MPGSEGCPWDRTEFVDHKQVQDALFTVHSVSWLVGAGLSLELMIRTAARKLPASNLLDTAAAILLLSFDFLLVLLSVVCEWTVGTASVPCSCASVDNVAQISLRAKMEQLKPSCFIIGSSSYSPEDLCRQCCKDALAARGMRLTSVTQEGCDSFDPLHDVAGDCSS